MIVKKTAAIGPTCSPNFEEAIRVITLKTKLVARLYPKSEIVIERIEAMEQELLEKLGYFPEKLKPT